MIKGKEFIYRLAEIMAARGIRHVVVSPGSRNAPVVIIFSRTGKLRLVSVADERSAGFFALGMAQQLQQPVALICTSGSAAINYGPAISEAYYQKVPLLVITADRPVAWIDQGDGQTIRQNNLFANYIRKSYQLPDATADRESRWHFDRMVNEAIDHTWFPAPGPVHLNLPLSEPLYDLDEAPDVTGLRIMEVARTVALPDATLLEKLSGLWNASVKKMILAGQMAPGKEHDDLLRKVADDPSVVVLTETTSNLRGNGYIGCIDRVIEGWSAADTAFAPDILVTLGGAVISKKIKGLLRGMRPAHHWHINPDASEFHLDTYQSLTLTIPAEPSRFFREFKMRTVSVESNYRALWAERDKQRRVQHAEFMKQSGYSDIQVYEILFSHVPEGSHIHLGNSTPVRYAQLFDHDGRHRFWSNRGTSGIDGSVSTAVGAAWVTGDPVTVISGDIGFFYDSNALWNHNLSPRLRIVVINNGGGNIFRVLPGPDRYGELETFLETAHSFRTKGIAETFGVTYFRAGNAEELRDVLPEFYKESGSPALLEIVTPARESAAAIRNYFKYMIQ